MGPQHRRYVIKETAISTVINSAFSAFFAWLVFGSREAVALFGPGGLAIDFVPQTVAISLFSIVIPTLITRKRLRAGAVERLAEGASRLPRSLVLRVLLVAAAATLVLGGLAVLALGLLLDGPLRLGAVYVLKICYGALVAVVATPIGLRAALAEKPA